MRIFIYGEYADWQKEYLLEALAGEVEIDWGKNLPEKPEYNILVWGNPQEEFISSVVNLEFVIVPYAGIPNQTLDLATKYPFIKLHNLHHNALPTAEMAFSLLLTAAKSIITAHNKLASGDWTPRYEGLPNRLLAGRKTLILGYGNVGRHIAEMCQAMKMKVMAIRSSIKQIYQEKRVQIHPAADLEKLLKLADVLFVTLPLTKETENILNRSRLELLPEGAMLMNIGRGKLIEEAALYDHLKSGRISAAALDVWYNYPGTEEERSHTFPGNYPFHELENVVLSPHRGGSFANYETELLRVQHLADMINQYLETGKMPNQVNIDKGY